VNLAIKTLEEIGQNSSLKDFNSLHKMLSSLELKDNTFDTINLIKQELVCGLLPEDDNDDNDKKDDKKDDDNGEE
jgi:hypothetical protein